MIKTDEPLTQVEVRPLTELPKKKVGLMGGTFNPPHLGHLIIAKEVKEQLGLDEVWFMPDNLPPHIDKKDALEAKYRVKMVALSIKDEPDFKLEELEIKRGGSWGRESGRCGGYSGGSVGIVSGGIICFG